MPRAAFARDLCSAVHDREHASLLSVLASKPALTLYHRLYGRSGFRHYLQQSTQGQQAAQIRFQLRSGTSTPCQHDSQFRDKPSHDRMDRICSASEELESGESTQHVTLPGI